MDLMASQAKPAASGSGMDFPQFPGPPPDPGRPAPDQARPQDASRRDSFQLYHDVEADAVRGGRRQPDRAGLRLQQRPLLRRSLLLLRERPPRVHGPPGQGLQAPPGLADGPDPQGRDRVRHGQLLDPGRERQAPLVLQEVPKTTWPATPPPFQGRPGRRGRLAPDRDPSPKTSWRSKWAHPKTPDEFAARLRKHADGSRFAKSLKMLKKDGFQLFSKVDEEQGRGRRALAGPTTP